MKLKLVEKREEVTGVTSFIFDSSGEITWKPGQFLHYVVHHSPTDDRGSDRWFTNSAAPFEKQVRITTRYSGEASSSFKRKLFSLPIGKNVEFSIVDGDFTLDTPSTESVFIAGGIGITPFRSILKQLEYDKKPINVTLLYANRDENIVFKDELESIASANPNFKIQYVISPARIDEATITEFIKDTSVPVFYVSGPEPMVDAMSEMLKNKGVSENNIKGDWFPGYPAE